MYPTQQLRRLARIKNGSDHSQVQDDLGEFPVYGSGGEFARASRPLYSGPSVLLGRKGTIDRPLLVDGEFWTVDTMFCAQPYATVNPTYLYYACTTIPFDLLSTSTALPSMTQGDLNAVRLPAPETETQRLIAEFLDRETAKIDALIDKQEQLIATLREDRAATITRAVTKGLDPDVELVAQGADFPAIPAHWQVLPIKRLGNLVTGGTPATGDSTNFTDPSDGLPWFRPEDLDTRGRASSASKALSSEGQTVVPRLTAPSVHVVSIGATLGKIGLVEVESASNQQITAVIGTPCPRFTYFALVASYDRIWAASMGNTLPIISAGRLAMVSLPVPPVEEQAQIARHLTIRCAKIDSLIDKATEMIQVLREYRSALITNAVTGKIDVREAV